MFLSRVIRNIREELKHIEFSYNGEINVFKMNDNIVCASFVTEEKSYFIEYNENGLLESKYKNKIILENNGINTGIVKGSNNIIIYEDYIYGDDYRTAEEKDFQDENFVRLLAKWCKKFYSIEGLEGISYFDCFSIKNLVEIKEKYFLVNNKFVNYVEKNFDNICLKFNRIKSGFVISNISMKNIVVSKKNSELLIVDFKDVFKGSRTVDVVAIFKFLSEEMQKVFYEEYGIISEEEFVVNEVVMCLVNLFMLIDVPNKEFEIGNLLNCISSEKMYEKAKVLVNWY